MIVKNQQFCKKLLLTWCLHQWKQDSKNTFA